MRVAHRIARLERVRGGLPSPACGFGPGARPGERPVRVERPGDRVTIPPVPASDLCGACGRAAVTRVVVLRGGAPARG